MDPEKITTVNTRHDIGLVSAARLVAVFWAGLVPVVVPVWLIVKAEMVTQNLEQDKAISRSYVSRAEFDERMRLLDERARVNTDVLREIREEQRGQRTMLEQISQRGGR